MSAGDRDTRRDVTKLRVAIARHLRDIEQLALDLHAQALNTPNDRDFPGGTALHMLAPAIPRQDWLDQYAEVEMQSYEDGRPLTGWNDPIVYQSDEDANEHPLYVLATWSRMWREEFDQPTQLKATVSREVDYLRKILDRVCEADQYGEPVHMQAFDMADDLRKLTRRMEDVTHEGTRPTFGVPCLYCGDNLLRVESNVGGLQDTYRCMNPECSVMDYDKAAYDKAVEQSYLLNATELTAEHMQLRTGVKASKVRVWGARYEGIKAGPALNPKKNHEGLLLYVVAAVEAKRDELAEEGSAA